MDWWQIGLIILSFIAAGIGTGVLASYLFRRFVKKPEATVAMAKKEVELAAKEIAKREAEEVKEMARREAEAAKRAREAEAMAKKETELAVKEIAEREAKEVKEIARREAEGVEEHLKSTADGLLAEVKNNRRIATEPLTDKLLPFQTDVWGTHQYEVDKLPANLRNELEQVYTDIRLANSIVWMSTEFNRRSQSLDEHYRQLCTSIAERLNRVNTVIEQLEKK